MPILLAALVGGVVFVVVELAVSAFRGKAPTLASLGLAFLGGAVGGAVFSAALIGLGVGGAATAISSHTISTTGRLAMASGSSGASSAFTHRVGTNLSQGAPALEGAALDTATGLAIGGAIPVAGRALKPVVQPVAKAVVSRVRGLSGALRGEKSGKVLKAGFARPAIFASVHPPRPAWLRDRIAAALRAVSLNAKQARGPPAARSDVLRFLNETYEHVREVNALVKAMGGRPRPLPKTAAPGSTLRGVHDFGERVSLRRVQDWLAELRRNPLRDRDGKVVPVPQWLTNMVDDASRAGSKSIDVGKLSPQVAAGLGRSGAPDLYAIKLHNFSGHHMKSWPKNTSATSSRLMEAVADMVNAMRQPRIYRPQPMSFAKIRQILLSDVESGSLPPSARVVIDRALRVQGNLERTGVVNPYYLLE
jgi:hypothetical protein